MTDQFEMLVIDDGLKVHPRPGEEIVDADDVAAGIEQPLAKMGPQEACAPRHQQPFL